jgi:hypothetical protein
MFYKIYKYIVSDKSYKASFDVNYNCNGVNSSNLGQCYKKNYGRNLRMILMTWSVRPGKPSLICVRVRLGESYPSDETFKCSNIG